MKLSRPKRIHISLLSIGIILGVGGFSGAYWLFFAPENNGKSLDTGTHYPPGVSQPPTGEQNASDVVPSSSLPSLPIQRKIEDLEEIRSPFDRELALKVLLLNSDEAQVASLLSQSMNLSSNDIRQNAQSSIVLRLTQLNPRRAMTDVLAIDPQLSPDRLIVTVFREWAYSDLDEAINQARTLNESRRDSALRAILKERTDLLDETRRSIATEVGNDQIAVEVLIEEKVDNAMENPEEEWEKLVLELQDDMTHRWRLAQVALPWIEKDGMGVMERVSTSLTNLQTRRGVVHRILQELANSNPSKAFSYALTMENDPFNSTKKSVVDVWARSDPRSALAAVSGMEKKTLRRIFQKSIADRWADKEPRKFLEAVETLPGHVIESATRAAISKIAEGSPKEAAGFVAKMESGDTRKLSAVSLAHVWMRQDHEATLDWILNEPAVEDVRRFVLNNSLYRIAAKNPELAMDAALAQPIAEGEMGLEGEVIGIVAIDDLDRAIELLSQVRKGPGAVIGFREVTKQLIRNGNVDEAVELVNQIPGPTRSDFYTGLFQAWAALDPSGLLKFMDRLPSKELKSKAARRLVKTKRLRGNLTDEQIEQVRKFLPDPQ